MENSKSSVRFLLCHRFISSLYFCLPLAVYRKLSSTLKTVRNGQRCLWLCGGLPSVPVVGASATMRFCTPAEVAPGSIGSHFPVTVPSSAHLSGRIPALSRPTDSRNVPLRGNGGGFPRGSVGLGCPVTAQQRRGTGSRVDSRPCHSAERNPAAVSTMRSRSPAPRGAVQALPQTSHPRAAPSAEPSALSPLMRLPGCPSGAGAVQERPRGQTAHSRRVPRPRGHRAGLRAGPRQRRCGRAAAHGGHGPCSQAGR